MDYPMQIKGHEFLADSDKFGLTDFDIILGMDWLSKYQTQIDYPK